MKDKTKKHLDKMRKQDRYEGCGCQVCRKNQYYLKMGRLDTPVLEDGTGWEQYTKSTFHGKKVDEDNMRPTLSKSWGRDKKCVTEEARQEKNSERFLHLGNRIYK